MTYSHYIDQVQHELDRQRREESANDSFRAALGIAPGHAFDLAPGQQATSAVQAVKVNDRTEGSTTIWLRGRTLGMRTGSRVFGLMAMVIPTKCRMDWLEERRQILSEGAARGSGRGSCCRRCGACR